MLEVSGFRGFRFDSDVVGTLDDVVTPPFDVISPVMRAELAQRSPYNMMHVLLPEADGEGDKYQAAARRLAEWKAAGAFKQDDAESFYLLEQTFRGLDGTEHVRRGFFAHLRIPDIEEDLVLDHERTFGTKVADRMRLTEETQMNLGAVFVLYADPNDELSGFLGQMDHREANITANTADGVTQRVWCTPQDDKVTEFFKGRKLYIADGHHRFRTAREYRDKMRAKHGGDGNQPYDFVLMGFVEMNEPGLVVWPTHRLLDLSEGFNLDTMLSQLEPWFGIAEAGDDLAAKVEDADSCTFGLALKGGKRYVLKLKDGDRRELLGDDHTDAWRDLDVAVLHRGIFEKALGLAEGAELVYEPKLDVALAAVDSGERDMAFLVRATPTHQIMACADAHDPMPEKATYFFPKLPSGAVVHAVG